MVSWRLNLIRKDEERAFIPEQISESSELCRLIQEKTFELAWPRALKRLQDNDECEFGLIGLSQEGLISDKDSTGTVKSKLLRWEEIGTIKTENSLQINKKKSWRPWVAINLWNLQNPHVFFALIATKNEWIEENEHD